MASISNTSPILGNTSPRNYFSELAEPLAQPPAAGTMGRARSKRVSVSWERANALNSISPFNTELTLNTESPRSTEKSRSISQSFSSESSSSMSKTQSLRHRLTGSRPTASDTTTVSDKKTLRCISDATEGSTIASAWDTFGERVTAMTKKIPKHALKGGRSSIDSAAYWNYNNNGFGVDEKLLTFKIERKEFEEKVVIDCRGQEISLRIVEAIDGQLIDNDHQIYYFNPLDKLLYPSVLEAINFNAVSPAENKGLEIPEDRLTFKKGGEKIAEIFALDGRGKEIPLKVVTQLEGKSIKSLQDNAYFFPGGHIYPTALDAIGHDAVSATTNNGKTTLTLCDGCSKNTNVAKVATRACDAGHAHTVLHLDGCKSTRDVSRLLFDSVVKAQLDIQTLNNNSRDTTYLQAAIVGNKLLGVSIGDSKMFVFRQMLHGWKCIDLTKDSRDTTALQNPGGFLKADPNFPPDTVGMKAIYFELQENDVVFACSDGVYDNFDPRQQNKKPSDVGITAENDDWNGIDVKSIANISAIEDSAKKSLETLIEHAKNAKEIRALIIGYLAGLQSKRMVEYLTNIEGRKWEEFPCKTDDAAIAYFTYTTAAKSSKAEYEADAQF